MNWDIYYMGFAQWAAKKSKDSTKVGAILVDPDGAVILTAYNGPPRGVEDTADRFERPRKYLFASHAERNLIAFAARRGITTSGCRVYCTHVCCASCAQTMIQAGIVELVFGEGTFQALEAEIGAVKEMCKESGLSLKMIPNMPPLSALV